MGGIGSGRPSSVNRPPVLEDFQSIDIRYWSRRGYIENHRNIAVFPQLKSKKHIPLHLYPDASAIIIREFLPTSFQGKLAPIVNEVRITDSNCIYGGKRIWFVCPWETCKKRVAILYLDQCFKCRHCMNKLYQSQLESNLERHRKRIEKIREQFGWSINSITEIDPCPKNMNSLKYTRVSTSYYNYVSEYLDLCQ